MPRPRWTASASYPRSSRMSHRASESLPPEMATSTRSPGATILCDSIVRRTCSRQWCWKQSEQNAARWRRTSITACAWQRLHLIIGGSPAADDGADLDVVAVVEGCVTRDQAVAADDEHRLAVEPQALHQVLHPQRARDLDLALRVVEV